MTSINEAYELVAVTDLSPHPRNARQGDLGAIHESILQNGFYGALVVQKSSGRILVGNHRYLAARQAGEDSLPVIYVDVDDDQALRILLADNRTNDLASYDDAALAELLSELARESERGLDGTGYDGDALDEILRDLELSPLGEPSPSDYSTTVESPIYEPTGEQPPVKALTDGTRRAELAAEIEAADVPADVREFLLLAAHRHTRFDYEAIANYYAHAPAETQRLMERSALVIIDFEQAIERGFVQLHESVSETFRREYPDA